MEVTDMVSISCQSADCNRVAVRPRPNPTMCEPCYRRYIQDQRTQNCVVDGCSRTMRYPLIGLCGACYVRFHNTNPCSFYGCTNTQRAKGLCGGHVQQLNKGRPLTPLRVKQIICIFEGCDKRAETTLCHGHLNQKKRGRPLTKLRNRRADGEGWISADGYQCYQRNNKMIYEHREVMEGVLGRPLTGKENVHHKNGIRSDNRLANLELWISSQPSGQRVEDLLAWAHEIIDRYENKGSAA